MNKKHIILTSCGHFDKKIVSAVQEDVAFVFKQPVFFKEFSMDISGYYNPGRRQYNANKIIEHLAAQIPENALKYIGLVRVDLFIPILTYIYGQGSLNGNIAVASLYRLRNELYGLKRNDALVIDRFSKVVIHEIGHMFGLIHCTNPVCIMRSSTYVEDIDQKEKSFCKSCQPMLNSQLKLNE